MVELHQVEVSQPGEVFQGEHLDMVTHLGDKYPEQFQVEIHKGTPNHQIWVAEILQILIQIQTQILQIKEA